jgi:hypothetical protein
MPCNRNEQATLQGWRAVYIQELKWLGYKVMAKNAQQFKDWLSSIA